MTFLKKRTRKVILGFGRFLFIAYILFLIYFLIFSDWYGRSGMAEYHYNLVLFQEIRRFWDYREIVGLSAAMSNLLGNILIFVPFGFFFPMASKKRSFFRTVKWSFGISLAIEFFQLISKVGCFDVDDLLLNTLGGIVGYICYVLCVFMSRRKYVKKTKRTK